MITVKQTEAFCAWLSSLKDRQAVVRIESRLTQMQAGSFGDVKPCGSGVSESRIHYGPGYRVYFIQRGAVLVVVLGGGTKRTQTRDIAKAKAIAEEVEKYL